MPKDGAAQQHGNRPAANKSLRLLLCMHCRQLGSGSLFSISPFSPSISTSGAGEGAGEKGPVDPEGAGEEEPVDPEGAGEEAGEVGPVGPGGAGVGATEEGCGEALGLEEAAGLGEAAELEETAGLKEAAGLEEATGLGEEVGEELPVVTEYAER